MTTSQDLAMNIRDTVRVSREETERPVRERFMRALIECLALPLDHSATIDRRLAKPSVEIRDAQGELVRRLDAAHLLDLSRSPIFMAAYGRLYGKDLQNVSQENHA